MDKMRELVDRLNETAYQYYVLDAPTISDKQWDELYDTLVLLEKESGVQLPDSPTHRVGGAILKNFEPHTHISRLWSMDKVKGHMELEAWFDRAQKLYASEKQLPKLKYAVEYKFDGLTINLTYKEGVLVNASTRGNGEIGEEILPQAKTVLGVPLSIPYKGLLEVQGECIMRLSALRKYNESATEPLKNARNAAAGGLRNLDPAVTASRHLSAFFYQVGTIQNPPYTDQAGMIDFLKAQKFPVSPYFKQADTKEEVLKAIDEIEEKRASLDFLIDGAVVKIQDMHTREVMGYTDKFPRWAVAYKFKAEENITQINDVTWELGRTGKLTPLAHVEPVDFEGVVVQKATLNNYGDILRKKLTLHTDVWIRRSNDVIPEIMGCVEENNRGEEIQKPIVCPYCKGDLTERGAHLFCLNTDTCKPQAVMRLKHYASRDAMDMESFSEKTADLFYEALGVKSPADLYRLNENDLSVLEGFKEKRIKNFFDAVEKSKHCTLDRFLLAVGIPNVGKKTARDLAQHFGTLDAIRNASLDELSGVDEIGDIVAQSIIDFFSYQENKEMIESLLLAGVTPQEVKKAEGGMLQGQSVVVTGTLQTLSRKDAEDLIRNNGGRPASSVSKKTALVVAGESAGSKLQKAHELQIKVLSEQEFLDMLS